MDIVEVERIPGNPGSSHSANPGRGQPKNLVRPCGSFSRVVSILRVADFELTRVVDVRIAEGGLLCLVAPRKNVPNSYEPTVNRCLQSLQRWQGGHKWLHPLCRPACILPRSQPRHPLRRCFRPRVKQRYSATHDSERRPHPVPQLFAARLESLDNPYSVVTQ